MVEVRKRALLGANVPWVETARIEHVPLDIVAARSSRIERSRVERSWIEGVALDVVCARCLALFC